MSHIAYYRVPTQDQSIESQRATMGSNFDEEFEDVGVSGSILAAKRLGFAKLLAFIRKGDTLHVYAVDRLGRDALDVQSTVRLLLGPSVRFERKPATSTKSYTGRVVRAGIASGVRSVG